MSVDEGHKRVLLIAASVLAARNVAKMGRQAGHLPPLTPASPMQSRSLSPSLPRSTSCGLQISGVDEERMLLFRDAPSARRDERNASA
jgi:hypothetical protein